VIGSTDPQGVKKDPQKPIFVEDLHATVLDLFSIDYLKELMTPVGRPMALSNGDVVEELVAG
jgi:hypothetical protein